jgi:pyruvate dehydrogenase E2 component (dihydrolipoamide acetyltransferase)
MAISIVMPALELAQVTGKLVAWLKKEGDSVAKGEPLAEVETDKAVLEIEAAADGVLAGIRAEAGAVVAVGETIAWIVAPGEVPPAEAAPTSGASRGLAGGPPASLPAGRGLEVGASEPTVAPRTKISPKARRLAREHGIDISRVRGSGPGREILASDILALVETASSEAGAQIETPGTVGRLMAERMVQSWTTAPHFFVVREAEAGALVEARDRWRAALEPSRGVRITHTDVLVALVARLLRRHGRLNATWTPEGIRLHPEIHIALAMAVEDGVVAGVIHNADGAELADIAIQRRDLAERARAGRLRPSDIAGATFTISNLGMYNVDAFSAIITPPQAAVLAVGRIASRVVPVGDLPGIRPMLTLTLSCDHRVLDGARAAAFLNDLVEALREPEKLLRTGGPA